MIGRAPFGRTGHESSRVVFGAAALARVSQGDADRALDLLLAHGINRSLERLGVDRIDSLQLHNLVDVIEWETALGAGGALEAAVEAREAGLVRFIGVTGHGLSVPQMHRRSLERFPFDSVLCPYNYVQMQDPRYAQTFDALAEV